MKQVESLAYQQGSETEETLMEYAGKGVAKFVEDFAEKTKFPKEVTLFCGQGNNGGDAYTAGYHLLEKGYNVTAYQLGSLDQCSPLCQKNRERFTDKGGKILSLESKDSITLTKPSLFIDGLIGTGMQGELKDPLVGIIQKMNAYRMPVFSIDVPSGVSGETGDVSNTAVHSHATLFLGLPKLGCILGEGWEYAGRLVGIDLHLPKEAFEEKQQEPILLSPFYLRPLLPPIKKNRHKYEAGLVLGIAGSPGMSGAAIMASLSSLRGGAGMITLCHPKGMEGELSSAPWEIVKKSIADAKGILENEKKAKAFFIGPGIGTETQTKKTLKDFLSKTTLPGVIDADALTLIGNDKKMIPKKTVLTPHLGELQTLLGSKKSLTLDAPLLKKCQDYVNETTTTLVLKGSPTFIFHPKMPPIVSPFGDPGMATAGCGDILTGLISAFLAQGLPPQGAALLGVYIHGISGEYAAKKKGSYSLIATDLIEEFPKAFLSLSPKIRGVEHT